MSKRKQQKRMTRRSPRRQQHSTIITKRKRTENAVKKLNALLQKAQGRKKQHRKRTNQKGNGLFAVLASLLGTVISSAIADG